MLNEPDLTPLYSRIMRTLVAEYKNEPAGTLIPSEKELMERFRVSRGTVRRAIMELTQQGFLYSVQGKGTFTSKDRIRRDGRVLLSLTEAIESHGYTTRADILRFETITPPLRVLRALELKTEDQVYLIKRIRFIEDDPIALITSYLPCAIIPGLTRRDVELSVYKALRKFNFEPVMARDIFRARVADKKTAAVLDCLENPAVFEAERVAYAQNNIPIEYVKSIIRGEDYALTVEPHSVQQSSRVYFHHDRGEQS